VKIALAVRAVLDSETRIVDALDRIGERHRADHDVFHLSRTLIRVHRANLDALAPFAERYGKEPGEAPELELGSLLHDLRELHLLYAAASIDWVLLTQGAKALRDGELLTTASECHDRTLRGLKWTVTRLKTAAPQVLAG
jgi:hypothetical protein